MKNTTATATATTATATTADAGKAKASKKPYIARNSDDIAALDESMDKALKAIVKAVESGDSVSFTSAAQIMLNCISSEMLEIEKQEKAQQCKVSYKRVTEYARKVATAAGIDEKIINEKSKTYDGCKELRYLACQMINDQAEKLRQMDKAKKEKLEKALEKQSNESSILSDGFELNGNVLTACTSIVSMGAWLEDFDNVKYAGKIKSEIEKLARNELQEKKNLAKDFYHQNRGFILPDVATADAGKDLGDLVPVDYRGMTPDEKKAYKAFRNSLAEITKRYRRHAIDLSCLLYDINALNRRRKKALSVCIDEIADSLLTEEQAQQLANAYFMQAKDASAAGNTKKLLLEYLAKFHLSDEGARRLVLNVNGHVNKLTRTNLRQQMKPRKFMKHLAVEFATCIVEHFTRRQKRLAKSDNHKWATDTQKDGKGNIIRSTDYINEFVDKYEKAYIHLSKSGAIYSAADFTERAASCLNADDKLIESMYKALWNTQDIK